MRTSRIIVVLVFLLSTFIVSSSTQAQPQGTCMPHEAAVLKLKQTYGEEKVGLGLGVRGDVVFELFISDAGTWTLLATRTNGISCIAASGNSWMDHLPFYGENV